MTRPPARPDVEIRQAEQTSLAPLFHLILLDDDDHSYEYVIDLLAHVFGYGHEKAFAMACAVDSTGRAIVETAGLDSVTRHQAQIHAFGRDPRIPRCQGSMSSIIEAAP